MRIRASRRLRAHLLLWVWVTVPPLALIRHSSPVFVHYFLDLYPPTFVISGLAVLWSFEWIQRQSWITSGFGRALQRRGYPLARTAIIGVVGTVVALQGLSWGLYASALAQGQFRVDAGFGYPLGELQAADRALASLQRRLGATVVLSSNPWAYQAPSIQYVLASEQSSRTAFSGNCLLLPAPSAPAALVVTTQADSDAARFLQAFLAPARVDSIHMPGGDPFEVYRLRVPLGMLPGERVLAGAVFSDASGARLRLESWARDDAGKLRLRWSVLSDSPAGADPVWYRIVLHAYDKTATHTPVPTSSSCEPTQWQAGETLFTWTDIVPAGGQGQIALDRDVMLAPVAAVQVLPYVVSRWEPHVGLLRTESVMVVERSLPPLAGRMDKGTEGTDQYPLPSSALTP